ncbi:MAG: IS200/IS605 family transposase [Calditrichaeota bacterium]|nr:IS200/IS605 family transposase [Calditrichota bacterium]
MSYVRIWLHCVWGTKNRQPFLTPTNKKLIICHIRENAEKHNIYIDFINGHREHLHCIISLNKDQTIAKVMQLIKGEVSHWINKNRITKTKFEWADEYFAVSVGESQLNRVREYIKNQEKHHRRRTWQEEYEEFIAKYGFTRMRDYD